MKIYLIGTKVLETWGHGHNVEELQILQEGMDQEGKGGSFPPAFKTPELAQTYLDALRFNSEMQVAELNLID